MMTKLAVVTLVAISLAAVGRALMLCLPQLGRGAILPDAAPYPRSLCRQSARSSGALL